MELGTNVLNSLRHRAALDLAVFDFAGTAVNGFAPLRFGVSIDNVVKTGDELMGQECPVLSRQREDFGDFFSGNAYARYPNAIAGYIQGCFSISFGFTP